MANRLNALFKEVLRLLNTCTQAKTQDELTENGLNPKNKPSLSGLHFVQIDEFYPIEPTQHNSFYAYVRQFYLNGFGLDADKALLNNCAELDGITLREVWPDNKVDLTLRYRNAIHDPEARQKQVIENNDQWCVEYEQRIRIVAASLVHCKTTILIFRNVSFPSYEYDGPFCELAQELRKSMENL